MKRNVRFAALLASAVALICSLREAWAADLRPSGNCYITDDRYIYVISPSGTVTRTADHSNQETVLAIITSGTSPIVRTTTMYNNDYYGNDYDLAGNYIPSAQYPQTASGPFSDGTSDGTTYNYAINWLGDKVYRYGADWSNPSLLFTPTLPPSGSWMGITYDPSGDGSLWLLSGNSFSASVIEHVDLSGQVLSSFGTSYTGNALSRDPRTGYLWFWTKGNGRAFAVAYNSSGNELGSFTPDYSSIDLFGINFNGGEMIPEPSAAVLVAVLGLVMIGRAWLRRRKA
jgi:hypothetical protein